MTEREDLERAIAALEAQRAILGDAVVDLMSAAAREKLAALEPGASGQQRRQVTVLFADVSGFTAMSETMDAEDVSDVMNAVWERLDKAITEQGGRIDKHMGDAVMAVWGTEAVREDDPERAIRAALAMQAELAAFRDGQPFDFALRPGAAGPRAQDGPVDLAMRIGINTGPVLLGQVGTTGEYTAIGDTVNLASRLEHAAPVGSVLVSHDTYRHVRGVFDVYAPEPIRVKGKAEPIQVYVVQRAKPRAFRLSTRGVEGIETRMIGREAELKHLQDALYTAMEGGQRRMVTISGDAGVGKSRLLYEYDNWIELLPETIRYFKGRASPEMQTLPYALIRDLFSFRFEIRDSDRAGVVWEKMERGIGEAWGRDEQSQMMAQMRAHLIGQWLGFDFSDSPHLQGVLGDAKQIHDRALIYLSEFFQATTELSSTVIFLEDIHWADASSLNVIDHLALTTMDQRLLIVCLARPTLFERRPHWGEGQAFHARLELRPLSKRDSHRLVEEILQRVEQVPVALRDLVVRGAEGNPFYVEELVKMLIEDGVILKEKERWTVEPIRLTQVRVPPTLTSVLQARLDSLPLKERAILQQASVVGRTFWDSTVVRISESTDGGMTEEGVPDILSALQDREMVFRRGTSAFAETQEYIFKHAVLREVTYESVLKRVRRVYHTIVAEWLIDHSGERAGEVTGLIADHLELAGQTERAATYLRRAGEQAAGQFANAEAVAYLSRTLDLTPEDDLAERYALLLAREKVYDLQGQREAQRQDLAALEDLAETLADDERRAKVALRQAKYAEVTGDFQATIAAARIAIRLAQAVQDVSCEASGYLRWAGAFFGQGDYEAARTQLEHALALAQAAQLRQVEADSLRRLGTVSHFQGDYAEARAYWEQALLICREIGDRRGAGLALVNLGVAWYQDDYAEARAYWEQALLICREIGDRRGESLLLSNLGRVSHSQGDSAGAMAYLEQALRIFREIGDRRGEGLALVNLGDIARAQRDYAGARAYLEQGLLICREIGDRQVEGWGLSYLGHVSTGQGDYAEARAYYEQALLICREIGDRQGESKGLASLGLLFHHLGDDEAARENSQQALLIAQDLGDHPAQGHALTNLGHALAGLGHLAEAADAYRQALNLRRELGEQNLAIESLAGLARVSLTRGNLTQALVQTEEILSYLESNAPSGPGHGLDGTNEPFRIYLTCYHVLRANKDPRAQGVLDTAHRLLQEQAAGLSDEELRRSFLENVSVHREILSEFRIGREA